MKYRDLRKFCAALEGKGELRRVREPVSALTNLFGTPRRVAPGMGASEDADLLRLLPMSTCWPGVAGPNRE